MNLKSMYIYIYQTMITGGIENYIYESIISLKKQGHYIGWIKRKDTQISDAYKNIMINKVDYVANRLEISKLEKFVKLNKIQEIKVIAFSVYDFVRADIIKNRIKLCKIDTFYFVPHFTMGAYYLEEYYKKKNAIKVNDIMKKVFIQLYENNNIYFFAPKHQEKVEDTYGIKVRERTDLLVPSMSTADLSFDEERIKRLYNREEFNILIVSRLEFPHKAFMKGALEAYIQLKPMHSNLTLTIIGDGPNKREIIERINECDEKIKKDINMVGTVAPEILNNYYDDTNLLISLAGCLTKGAKKGVLSIPARHYCYDCEVYGFMPESCDKVLSSEPGVPVIPFIKKAMELEYKEYYQQCKKTFDFYQYNNSKKSTMESLKNSTTKSTLTIKQEIFITITRFIFETTPYLTIRDKGIRWCLKKIITKFLK